jgi:hypothetical protein
MRRKDLESLKSDGKTKDISATLSVVFKTFTFNVPWDRKGSHMHCSDSYWTLRYIPMVLSKAPKWQGLKPDAVLSRYTHLAGKLQAQVQSTDNECGVRSWPWHWFVLRKPDRHLLVASNRRTPVKTTLDWSAEAFRARTIIRLFTVLYCTVLFCTVLYCTVLYYTILYCTVLYA